MPAVSSIAKTILFQCTVEERERLPSTLRESLATREHSVCVSIWLVLSMDPKPLRHVALKEAMNTIVVSGKG